MTRTTIHSDYIPDNAITGVKIAENSITAREIATNAITTLYVADDSVTADKLANSINTDIATGVTGNTTANAALPKAGGTMTGALTTNGVINTGTSHNFALNTPNSLRINIDSNNSATDQIFVIGHNQTSVDNNNALMTILESGNVGIGTSSPASPLTVHADGIGIRLDGTADTTRRIFFRSTSSSNPAEIYADGSLKLWTEDAGTDIRFHTNSNGTNNERMRITSAGDLWVGKTEDGTSNAGHVFFSAGAAYHIRSGGFTNFFNRTSSDGEILRFAKDGTAVGAINSLSGRIGIGSGDTAIFFDSTRDCLSPFDMGTNDGRADVIDIGRTGVRFNKGFFRKLDATDSNGNTSIGYESHNVLGASGNSGDSNVAIGYQANEKLTTGSWNNAHGYRAGMNVTSGYYNVAIGGTAMYTNQGGHRNTAVGYQAYYTGNGNDHNTAIGNRAMVSATTVGSSTAVGSQALEDIQTAHYCTAVGMRAGLNITTGQSNTCVGVDSLEDTQAGANNTAIGSNAGANITSGSNNVMLGYLTGKSGHPGATTSASNRAAIGNSNTASFHCQTALSVASDVRDKTDFTNLDLGLDFIKSITPYTFKWDKRTNYVDWTNNPDTDLNTITHDGTHKEDQLDIGFKAQDIEALEIAANYKESDKTNLFVATDDDGKKNLKYEKLIPVLVKAIQELEARIETLEG